MKRNHIFTVAICLCLCLAGCGKDTAVSNDKIVSESKNATQKEYSDTAGNDILENSQKETKQDDSETVSDFSDSAAFIDDSKEKPFKTTESVAENAMNTSDTSITAEKEDTTSSSKTEPVKQETQPAHIHTMQYYKQVSPTCTADGTRDYWHCSGCNKNYSDKKGTNEINSIAISAKGHTSGGWITDKQPTEASEGSRHISCTVCGVTLQIETLAKLPSQKLSTTTYSINGVDFKMILVEAGTFIMGSDNTNVAFSESPAHKVTLTKDYLMGETEVTEALWNAVMGNGGGSNTQPKTSITWKEAHTFADRLTKIAREQGIISENVSFRLPTEAQWEFAAKGGNLSKGYLYSGSNDINEVAQTLENTGSNSPVAVKGKAPNELGIYDMSGNAYEWADDYGGAYSSADQVDPQNTTVSNQYVKRGGSNYHGFNSESYLFTTTGRYFYGSTDWTIGMRLCLY